MSEGAGSPPTPMSPGPTDDDAEPLSLGRRAGRVLALVAIVSMAGLWLWAWFGPVDRDPPGILEDPAFAQQAQQICTETAGVIRALPPAFESPDADARAEVIAEANTALDDMLDQLEAIAPSAASGTDGEMVQEWLGDWRTYLGDRQRYVAALEADPRSRFLVTEKEGGQITEPIEFFAKYNDMDNCVAPGDLA